MREEHCRKRGREIVKARGRDLKMGLWRAGAWKKIEREQVAE